MRHLGGLGVVLQFDEGIGHGSEAKCAQAFDGRTMSRFSTCETELALLWQIRLFREPVRIPESIFQ
jgi:hypothetical protein